VKHFDDFVEDQFDFHSYCLRKVTLRSYVSLLRFEDEVYGQSYFCEAAGGIIRIYLHLYDHPVQDEDEEPDYTKMNAAEKKKAKAIARKKKKASEKKEAELQSKKEDNGNQKGIKPAVTEEDPFGKQYLKKEPLEEAKKLSAMLTKYAPNKLETWILQYDVAIRRKKALMALQSLFKAKAIDPYCSDVFSRIVDFGNRMNTFELTDAVKTVVTEDAPKLVNCKTVLEYIGEVKSKIMQNAETDLPLRTEVAKALVQIGNGSVDEACSIIVDGGMDSRRVSLSTCREAYDVLTSFGDEAQTATKLWMEKVQYRFPGFQ
jgi:N-alpha-acetyltransferase 15/16, NatA auxiliary subunit